MRQAFQGPPNRSLAERAVFRAGEGGVVAVRLERVMHRASRTLRPAAREPLARNLALPPNEHDGTAHASVASPLGDPRSPMPGRAGHGAYARRAAVHSISIVYGAVSPAWTVARAGGSVEKYSR